MTRNRRTGLLLGGLVLLMFGFGFAMVPLYNLLCQVTGTQSVALRSDIGPAGKVIEQVDQSRLVTVKFDTTVHPNLPWNFATETQQIRVYPGKIYQVDFQADNRSSAVVTGQAIPSLAPWQATPYFSKLECFCFNQQTLQGHEHADMPLRFMVSPDLPEEIRSLTLSYSFMRLQSDQPAGEHEDNPPNIITTQSRSSGQPR